MTRGDDADDAPAIGTGTLVGAAVIAFLVITPLSVPLMGFNWTQAVLIGGFSAVISALAAWVSAGRAAGD